MEQRTTLGKKDDEVSAQPYPVSNQESFLAGKRSQYWDPFVTHLSAPDLEDLEVQFLLQNWDVAFCLEPKTCSLQKELFLENEGVIHFWPLTFTLFGVRVCFYPQTRLDEDIEGRSKQVGNLSIYFLQRSFTSVHLFL